MTRGQQLSLMRRLHRWLGLVAAVFVLVAAATGVLLQHPEWLGRPALEVHCVAADPTDSGRLLRGTTWGVDESTDGGETWRELPMLAPPADVVRIRFLPDADGEATRVVALGRQAAVESADGGRIWRELVLPEAALRVGATMRDITAAADGRLLLLTGSGLFVRGPDGAWTAVVGEEAAAAGWRDLVHDLHTGQIAGAAGRRVVTWGGWGLVVITLTGVILGIRTARRPRS